MSVFLVTGGAGFIGSRVVRRLLDDGHRVRVLDNFSTGCAANLSGLPGALEILEGDVAIPDDARRAVEGVEYVLHQAALPSVPRSLADPVATDRSNVQGTLQILLACRDAGVRRVVHASSSSVYGDTETLPKVESQPLAPRSPYAASKAAGEHYGLAFHRSFGVPYVGLRYFNVFGPGQDPASPYAAVIPRFIHAYLQGETPVVEGDGHQSRDFCYVANVVEANLSACARDEAIGCIFNVACGERVTLLEVLELLAAQLGRRLEPRHVAARAGDVRHSLADLSLSRERLGYEPQVRFAEGLHRTVRWFAERLERSGDLVA